MEVWIFLSLFCLFAFSNFFIHENALISSNKLSFNLEGMILGVDVEGHMLAIKSSACTLHSKTQPGVLHKSGQGRRGEESGVGEGTFCTLCL